MQNKDFIITQSEELFFFCCIVKLNHHKCSFAYPLLLIQIPAEKLAFIYFRVTNLAVFGHFT